MPTNLQLNAPTLATDCYPASPQALINEAFEKGSALLGDMTGIIISDSQPAATDRDKAWLKTNAGAPSHPPVIYKWFNGQWVAPHPSAAGESERRLWVGSTVNLQTYDGGDAGAAGAASGPMWEVDTAIAAQFLLTPGTLASGTVVAVGDTGGSEDVTLTTAQIPAHAHAMQYTRSEPSEDPAVLPWEGIFHDPSTRDVSQNTDNAGGGEAHTNMPPWYGIYVIKRTNTRIYYVG